MDAKELDDLIVENQQLNDYAFRRQELIQSRLLATDLTLQQRLMVAEYGQRCRQEGASAEAIRWAKLCKASCTAG